MRCFSFFFLRCFTDGTRERRKSKKKKNCFVFFSFCFSIWKNAISFFFFSYTICIWYIEVTNKFSVYRPFSKKKKKKLKKKKRTAFVPHVNGILLVVRHICFLWLSVVLFVINNIISHNRNDKRILKKWTCFHLDALLLPFNSQL